MLLRCLLFTSDGRTAAPICHALADLAVEVVHCSEVTAAAAGISGEPFQIVIVDWDDQPDALVLLKTARERKLNERALTLAIVSDDQSVPKALQSGANSILRKPLMASQLKDTLTTARDLLRARESASVQAAAVAAKVVPAPEEMPFVHAGNEASLRAGEFLQSSAPAPAMQYDTESEMQKSMEQSAAQEIDPLKDLEPMAAAVQQEAPPSPVPSRDEPRGLQWYLNQRAGTTPLSAPYTQAAPAAAPEKPELLGFDQTPSFSPPVPAVISPVASAGAPAKVSGKEENDEAQLFAYIDSGKHESEVDEPSRPRIGKGAIAFATLLAACAVAAAPQAPWHPQVRGWWAHEKIAIHSWLNPQPVTTVQTPPAHEDFGRAGDEYKLPVAENIPDATTDPSQIRVVPVVDPTKKPTTTNADPNAVAPDGTTMTPTDSTPPPEGQSPEPAPQVQTPQVTANPGSGTVQPAGTISAVPQSSSATPTPVAGTETPGAPRPDPFRGSTTPLPPSAQPPVTRNPQPRPVSTSSAPPIPSSLKSQMASMTPEASGNKPPDAALPSIEPVPVSEAAERALLSDQPAIHYPPNVRVQQGTVILQVLIGRDGTVQDAKFLQGSLAFARTAIDGVKLWKFKPYALNGRPVSVQTQFTISFKPGQ